MSMFSRLKDFIKKYWVIFLIIFLVITSIISVVLYIVFKPPAPPLVWTDYQNLYWGQTLHTTTGKGSNLLGSATSIADCRSKCNFFCPNAVTYNPASTTNNCWSGANSAPTINNTGYISSVGA